jgi:hypothetical protein
MFASQSRWFLEAYRREDEVRSRLRAVLDLIPDELRERPEVKTALSEAYRPVMSLVRLAWRPGHEIGIRPFDYSERAVAVRWTAGERTAAEALRALREGREARGEDSNGGTSGGWLDPTRPGVPATDLLPVCPAARATVRLGSGADALAARPVTLGSRDAAR